jgi:hypothetical protein
LKVNQRNRLPSILEDKIKDYAPAQREALYLISERSAIYAIKNLYGGCETCYQFSIKFPEYFKTNNILDESEIQI